MKPKTVLQHDMRDCGAACLSTISAFYKRKLPLSQSRFLCKTDHSGSSLYGIMEAAKMVGFTAEALNGTPEELLTEIHNDTIKLPLIAHIVNDQSLLHFVVVFQIRGNHLLIGDPAKGTIQISADQFFSMWTGHIIVLSPDASFKQEKTKQRKLPEIFKLLQGQWKAMILIMICSIVIAGIGVAGSFVFQFLIDSSGIYQESDEYSIAESSESSAEEHAHEEDLHDFEIVFFKDKSTRFKISVLCISIVFMYLIQTAIQIVRGFLILEISRSLDMRLSLQYYCHIQDARIEGIRNYQTGELMSRLSDAAIIRDTIATILISILLDTVMVVASGIILCSINLTMFVVSAAVMLIYCVLVLAFKNPLERANRNAMEKNAELQSYFKETVDGIETIRAASSAKTIKNTAFQRFTLFLDAIIHSTYLGLIQEALSEAVEMIGCVIIICLGFYFVSIHQITAGRVLTFYALLSYFTTPVKNLIRLQPQLQKADIAAERLKDVIEIPSEENNEQYQPFPEEVTDWRVEHVFFRYGYHPLVLEDVSLNVKRGQKIGIVGESGCGKTSLGKLFLRFYEPEEGNIYVNDLPINTIDLAVLRKKIAYVSQETFLFSDTLRNNLLLGMENISDDFLNDVCKKCMLEELISGLPLGIDTPIEECGANFSGGQRQRIALARALLRKPELLILDEATSHLDTLTENAIMNTILGLNHMSVIIIAHRLQTIKRCDRIYVMADGRILESDTHARLMAKGGKYALLWDN